MLPIGGDDYAATRFSKDSRSDEFFMLLINATQSKQARIKKAEQ
jgi:hypothetical protein